MNKLSWITGALVCVTVLLTAIGAVCGAVDRLATDEQFYSGMSRAAVIEYLDVGSDPDVSAKITAYIGLDDAQQTAFAGEMTAFMAGETDVQPTILSDKEQQHMLDVRGLTLTAAKASQVCFTLAAVLMVIAAWTGAKLKRRILPQLIGALSGVTVIAAVAAFVASALQGGSFAKLFVGMHEMLFTNDLWLMDPQTDILIRMMPQPLFEQALTICAEQALRLFVVVWIMLIAVHFIVTGMIHRHVTKGE